jgi:hypothetical protein
MLKDLEFIVYDYIYVNLGCLVWCTINDNVTLSGPLSVCLCILANESEIKKIHKIDYVKLLSYQKVPLIDYEDYTMYIQIYNRMYRCLLKIDPAKYNKISEVFGDPKLSIYKNLLQC